MNEKIGNNAGSVWTVLHAAGERVNVKDLKKRAKLSEKALCMAMGWLARENKLVFFEEEKELFVALNEA